MDSHPTPRLPLPTLGVVLLLIGSLTLVLCSQMKRLGLGNNQDPGPAAFPSILAFCLIAGGVIEIVQWFRARNAPPAAMPQKEGSQDTWSSRQTVRLSLIVSLVMVYLGILGWAGFVTSTLILAPMMMIILGAQVRIALLNTVILVLLVKGLFGWALKVPLPAGEWGIPL